jgi:hypothetical protein
MLSNEANINENFVFGDVAESCMVRVGRGSSDGRASRGTRGRGKKSTGRTALETTKEMQRKAVVMKRLQLITAWRESKHYLLFVYNCNLSSTHLGCASLYSLTCCCVRHYG